MRSSHLLFVLALVLIVAASVTAADRERTPVFGSEVSLVMLPVFVADGSGHAMRGLGASDFELYEDGKRVEVVSFRYVDTTSDEDQQEIRQASPARRRFLLLFDKSFTDPSGLNRAQRAAAQFVRTRLAPSDLAAVATFDVDRGMRLIANFTEDRALLSHAVATLGAMNLAKISDPLALAADLAVTDLNMPGVLDSPDPTDPTLAGVLAVLARRMRAAEEEQYLQQIHALVAGFDDLARALRGVDGRKQILYFSAGFDSRLLIGQTGSEQRTANQAVAEGRLWDVDSRSRFGDTRVRQSVLEMGRKLSSADAVIHAVDVTGLGTDRSLTQTSVTVDPQRENGGRESLNLIATQTGGRLFKDSNNPADALDELLDMTSRYYILGFQPSGLKGPGAFHKVRVKVARKGAKLSHRTGYYEKTPLPQQVGMQRQFEAAQLVMTGGSPNDIAFSSLCLPFPVKGERQNLGLVIQVPQRTLHLAPGKPTALEVYAYAASEDGTVYDHLAQLARIDPARLDPDVLGLSFFGNLAVPPGRYTVRLLVQERDSGASGVQLIDVNVPPYDPKVGFLLPPVLMEDAGRWVSLEMNRRGAERSEYPFQVDGKPFLPRASFELQPGAAEKLVLLAYEPSRPGDPAASLQIRSSLRDRDGKLMPAGVIKIDKVQRDPSGIRTYVLGYTSEALSAGDYTLRIGIGEAGSQLEAYSLLRVRTGS
jgi:VWFA-related protein